MTGRDDDDKPVYSQVPTETISTAIASFTAVSQIDARSLSP